MRSDQAAVRAFTIVKRYGGGETAVTALRGVSLDVLPGEFVAVMGPSGSGKSTLLHCLAGLDTVDSGEVFVGGARLTGLRDRGLTDLRRSRIGFVFQQYNLIPTLDARENILLPTSLAGTRPDPAWFERVVAAVGLGDRLGHRPAQLSGGQQQRVACARALLGRPDVVFADEPTGNLDSRAGAGILALLRSSAREFGQTIVMVTHDPNAAGYADRVVFLADGSLAGELTDPSPGRILDVMRRLDPAEPADPVGRADAAEPAGAAGGQG